MHELVPDTSVYVVIGMQRTDIELGTRRLPISSDLHQTEKMAFRFYTGIRCHKKTDLLDMDWPTDSVHVFRANWPSDSYQDVQCVQDGTSEVSYTS